MIMDLNNLVTIDTAFTLYMGKVMGSATDPKLFPSPRVLHQLAYKLLSKAERNFVEKRIVDGIWDDVPRGMGSIWNLENTLCVAAFCTDNIKKLFVPKNESLAGMYQAVIDNRQSMKNNPAKLCATHIVPVAADPLDAYPAAVLKWIDNRFKYVMPVVLKHLKALGVPCPLAQNITVQEWDDLATASFSTFDEQKMLATDESGGEIAGFSTVSPQQMDRTLMANSGDEHIALLAEDFVGVYYLEDETHAELAVQAQAVLKGYWELFGACTHEKDAQDARQSFLDEVAAGINAFKDEMANQQTGAGIVIIE